MHGRRYARSAPSRDGQGDVHELRLRDERLELLAQHLQQLVLLVPVLVDGEEDTGVREGLGHQP
jgi:hypothetical protein